MQFNSDQLFIVNGCAHQAIGNFISDFKISKIGDTKIFISSYPDSDKDLK